ncbi:phosphatase PAP2 family protein [Amycolatopsis benzoatilytica]|uniref:phosphatase PAP2 family protein n=1 Tax=Amycolatopsis benzoatilytica TaxID=346045 RepID=UPI00048879B9|nr:phosphatase PAP2 family protein [Amycolatopsis benzoatilytica]
MNARRALALFAALCVLVAVAVGLLVSPNPPGALDNWAYGRVDGLSTGLLNALVLPTEPYVLIPAIAVIAGICLYLHRRRDAVLAVAGPVLAVALNTWALKPVFDRWKGGTLVYPSGHTVSLVAVLVVVVLLVRLRMAATLVSVVLLGCGAVGMIGLGYHYLTDIAGGACFATGVVTALRAALSLRREPAQSSG